MKRLIVSLGLAFAAHASAQTSCPQLPGTFTQGAVCPYPDPSKCFTAANANTIVTALSGVCASTAASSTAISNLQSKMAYTRPVAAQGNIISDQVTGQNSWSIVSPIDSVSIGTATKVTFGGTGRPGSAIRVPIPTIAGVKSPPTILLHCEQFWTKAKGYGTAAGNANCVPRIVGYEIDASDNMTAFFIGMSNYSAGWYDPSSTYGWILSYTVLGKW